MYNGEELNEIIIRNKDGRIIAEIDLDSLTCNNNKFKIMPIHFEDSIEIQLCQKTYK